MNASYPGDSNHLAASGVLDTTVAKAPTSVSINLVKRAGHPVKVVAVLAYPQGIAATGTIKITDGHGDHTKAKSRRQASV